MNYEVFQGAITDFLLVSFVLRSCSEDQNPSITKDPLLVERDSLLVIYGDEIDVRELEYLSGARWVWKLRKLIRKD